MSKVFILRCIKRHLKLGDYFPATFVTWNSKFDKIKLISKTKSAIVRAGTILQMVVIAIKIWSVVMMPASLIQRVIGIGIISVKTIAFLFPFELSSDHLPAQFLNYIYSTKGRFSWEICVQYELIFRITV